MQIGMGYIRDRELLIIQNTIAYTDGRTIIIIRSDYNIIETINVFGDSLHSIIKNIRAICITILRI